MSWIPDRTYAASLHGILPPLLCYYITAVLVQLPASSTWLIRISLLPITLYSTFWAATTIDFSVFTASMSGCPDPERYLYINQGLVIVMFGIAMRCTLWTFLNTQLPFRRLKDEDNSGLLLNAVDLCCGLRGCHWNFSKGLYIPPETRDVSNKLRFAIQTLWASAVDIYLVDVFHVIAQYSLPPGDLTTRSGILDPSLPPPQRYFLSTLTCLSCGLVVHFSISGFYNTVALFAVVFLGQHPNEWPPLSSKPWLSENLGEFWGKRWHQMFRDTFVGLGYTPLSTIGSRIGGKEVGKVSGVLGAFTVSGMLHYIGLWGMGRGSEVVPMVGFFFMQGVGVILERAFLRSSRGGFVGWIWTLLWVLGWAHVLVDCWVRKGLADSLFFPEFWRPGRHPVDWILHIARNVL